MRKKVIGTALALILSAGMMNVAACGFDEDYDYYADEDFEEDSYDDEEYDEDYEDEDYEGEDYEGEENSEDYEEEEYVSSREPINGYLPDEIEDTWCMEIDGVIHYYKLVDGDTYGSWYGWNDAENYSISGDIEITEGITGYEIRLYKDSDSYIYMFYGDDCGMVDENEKPYTREDDMDIPDYGDPVANSHFERPEDYDPNTPITYIIGTWVYMGYYTTPKYDDTYYRINEDGTFAHYSADDQLIEGGTYEIPGGDCYMTDLTFIYDDGREEDLRILSSYNPYIEDPNKYYLFRLEDFE